MAEDTLYMVNTKEIGTGEIIDQKGPMPLRKAEKVARGMEINMDIKFEPRIEEANTRQIREAQ